MESNTLKLSGLSDQIKEWKLRLRVIEKYRIQTPKSGLNKFQRFILADNEGYKIQAISFGNDISAFDETLQLFSHYWLSNGVVRKVAPRYRLTDNEYQIILNGHITVAPADLTSGCTSEETFQIKTLTDAKSYAPEKFDIITTVVAVLSTRSVPRKADGTSIRVRDIIVIDESLSPTSLSAWEDMATIDCERVATMSEQNPVLLITNVKASKYHDFSLTATPSTQFISDSNIPRMRDENLDKITEFMQPSQLLTNWKAPNTTTEFKLTKIDDLPAAPIEETWIKASVIAYPVTQRPWYTA